MDFWINIALITFGFLGALVAFGGDTLRNTGEPFYKRITSRGWVSIALLTLTLTVGIWKEVRAGQSASAALNEQKDLKRKLDDSRRALLSIEPSLLSAMYDLTARIPREVNWPYLQLRGEENYPTETQPGIELYGGDEFDYTFFCGGSGDPAQITGNSVKLHVGNLDYTLSGSHDVLRIAGRIGQAMQARIRNPRKIATCDLKIVVRSTDSTRVKTTFAPLIKAIEQAKQAREQGEL